MFLLQGDFDFGVWCEASPMPHRPPDLVKVINKKQAVRKGPKYPGKKQSDSYCEVDSEWEVWDHQIFEYEGVRIHCYRINCAGEEAGWLLDYSPGEDMSMLKIQYIN